MVKQLQHSPPNKSRLKNTHAKHVGNIKITLYFPNKRVDNPKKMIIKMGELTFPTTRAEIVDFLEATSAFWAKHDDYVSEEGEKTSRSCYTTYFGYHWPKTADHRFGFCSERFVFAVSNLFLPWAICSCYDEFWIVSPVFVFAVDVCSLPGVILICSSEFYFLALNLILPWQLWATVPTSVFLRYN